MVAEYTCGDFYVPNEDNRFWKGFKIELKEGHSTQVKYSVLCYSHSGEHRTITMDQECMVPMMRPPNETELKQLKQWELSTTR